MQQIQKPISGFLTGKPALTAGTDVSVLDAITLMKDALSEYLLIVDGNNVAGIFTERDFLNKVVADRLDPSETSIRDVMTADPDTLRPQDNITYAVERMATRGFRNIPIIADEGPAAMLTIWDVMSHLSSVLTEVEENSNIALEEWMDLGGG